MANTVNVQTLVDGERNAVLKVYLESDGVTGELSDQVVVDVSALSGAPSTVRLDRVEAELEGFTAALEWDATTDVPILNVTDNGKACWDFCAVGGLPNDAGAGVTGDITISTTGFAAAGDRGTLLLWVRK